MQTSLWGIANKAAQNRTHRFQNLISLLTVGFLLYCWGFVNKKAAAGGDRLRASEYARNLDDNAADLAESVKGGWYRAKLVLRKYIPKLKRQVETFGIAVHSRQAAANRSGGNTRSDLRAGFSARQLWVQAEDGCASSNQRVVGKTQERIFKVVVEADIKGFFDNIDHRLLLEMLKMRIDDKPFLKLIEKWLKAGILDTDGAVLHPVTGTPQGGIVSPLLANVYLHYVLDVWFEEVVKAHCKGRVYLCRYADDFVCAFEFESDAQRFYEVLPKRLAKYKLEVAVEKTHILQFDKKSKARFDFLGFEFRWGSNRWGEPELKRRTARNKYRAAIANFTQWCRKHRQLPTAQLFAKLNQKLRGYWNYYGIRGNFVSLGDYFYHIKRILFKMLNRRSQRKSYTWTGFGQLLEDFPLVKPHICHSF